jgi:hypothetical protein
MKGHTPIQPPSCLPNLTDSLPHPKPQYKMDTILDDPAEVRGVIYCIEHVATGKKYVGQTHTHRKNHGRYRPFGAEARFRTHVSEATCNTKHKSGHLLGIDIRQYGKDGFKCSTLELCNVDDLNELECKWIRQLGTMYPGGYNLTEGGTNIMPPAMSKSENAPPVIPNPTPLNTPRKRGGCSSRSETTRAKMTERAKELAASPEFKQARATNATAQHAANKATRFTGVKIDRANLDQYIFTKGVRVIVRVGDQTASFAGKSITQEENKTRAKEFLLSLSTESSGDVIEHAD